VCVCVCVISFVFSQLRILKLQSVYSFILFGAFSR